MKSPSSTPSEAKMRAMVRDAQKALRRNPALRQDVPGFIARTGQAHLDALKLLGKFRDMGMSDFAKYIHKHPVSDSRVLGQLLIAYEKQQHSQHKKTAAKHAADSRHDQPGGYREKHEKLRKAWASGLYASRDECALKESSGAGLSFSAARKALIGTPDPTRT